MHPARAAAVALVGAVLLSGCTGSPPPPGGGEQFAAARLPMLEPAADPPPPEPPKPDVSRTMFAAATLSSFAGPLDACRGPVAIDVQEEGRPLLVSEHDYCGGAAWIPALGPGDTVELGGPGVDAGLYEVSVVDRHQRRNVYVKDLRPEADVVLQTCLSKTQLVLVALTKVPDASV